MDQKTSLRLGGTLITESGLWPIRMIFLTAIWALMTGTLLGAAENPAQKFRTPGPDTTQIITLDDGSSLVGRITQVGENDIKFTTTMGEMTIAKAKIREVKEVPVSSMKGGQYWFPNPNRTRLFLGPTGRMLKKGEGYFTDVYLFFPGVAYGVTDNITIGGGVSLIPGLDVDHQLFYFTPKVGFKPSKDLDLAASILMVRVPGDDLDVDAPKFVGVLFGTGTIGNDANSLTFGVGFGYADTELADKPAVSLGGELRIARRLSLVSENWVFPEVDNPLISYGVRFFGESLAVDLALFNVLSEDAIFPGIPFIDFVWNF